MRVGTFQQSDVMLQHLLRQQTELTRTQEQIASGKKYDSVAGFGADTARLASSKSLLNQMQAQQDTNLSLLGRLNAFDTGLRELETIGGELRDAVQGARALGNGTGFRTEVTGLLERAGSVLNMRFEGRFIFGGLNTGQPPLLATNETEILALAEPPAGQFFADSGAAPTVRIDERATMTAGVAASEVAGDLMHAMQRILMFDSGTLPAGAGAFAPAGSLDGALGSNEVAYLADELDRVLGAVDTLQTAAAENGQNIISVEAVQRRLEDQTVSLTEMVANIEDIDLGEAATRLNGQQLSLQASMRMIAELRSMSLVNLL